MRPNQSLSENDFKGGAEVLRNAEEMFKRILKDDESLNKFGLKTLILGDPIVIDSARLPCVSLYFQSFENTALGIGHSRRSDITYILTIKVYYSTLESNYNYLHFVSASEIIYNYFATNTYFLTENIKTNKKTQVGPPPRIGNLTFGYQERIADGNLIHLNASSFSIEVTRHQMTNTTSENKKF